MLIRIGKFFITPVALMILFACALGSAQGQEVPIKTLTLQESIDIALAENLSMKTAEEAVETAKQKVSEARAAFMPVLSASGSYTYFGELPTMDFELDPSALGLPPEMLQMMGGDQQPSAEEESGGSSEIPMGEEDTYKVGLSLQQPIFTWGKIYNNYKQTKISFEASKQGLEATKQQIILDATTAFYGVLLTEKLVKVTEMAVAQVEAHVKIAQDLVDAGVATEFDLLRAKVQLANINSQLIKVKNALKLVKNGFKNALAMNLDAQINVKGELAATPIDLDLAQLIESAMANRPELKQLELQELVGEKYVSLAKAGNKPSLAFIGNYEYNSNADTLGDIFDGDEWKDTWNVTLALQVPIFDGLATRARVKQAKSGLKQIQIGKQQLSDGIGLEVRAAFFSFQESKDLLEVQAKTVEQAEESLRIANLRYKNGMITNVEFMDAELAFTQAQTNYFNALHDYALAIAKLEKASASEIN